MALSDFSKGFFDDNKDDDRYMRADRRRSELNSIQDQKATNRMMRLAARAARRSGDDRRMLSVMDASKKLGVSLASGIQQHGAMGRDTSRQYDTVEATQNAAAKGRGLAARAMEPTTYINDATGDSELLDQRQKLDQQLGQAIKSGTSLDQLREQAKGLRIDPNAFDARAKLWQGGQAGPLATPPPSAQLAPQAQPGTPSLSLQAANANNTSPLLKEWQRSQPQAAKAGGYLAQQIQAPPMAAPQPQAQVAPTVEPQVQPQTTVQPPQQAAQASPFNVLAQQAMQGQVVNQQNQQAQMSQASQTPEQQLLQAQLEEEAKKQQEIRAQTLSQLAGINNRNQLGQR